MSQTLDKKLRAVIDKLNDKQKKAILNVAQAFVEEDKTYDHWQDENFVAEMDKRYNDYKLGKSAPATLDEVEAKARKMAQSKK